jgi:hypothetical protein
MTIIDLVAITWCDQSMDRVNTSLFEIKYGKLQLLRIVTWFLVIFMKTEVNESSTCHFLLTVIHTLSACIQNKNGFNHVLLFNLRETYLLSMIGISSKWIQSRISRPPFLRFWHSFSNLPWKVSDLCSHAIHERVDYISITTRNSFVDTTQSSLPQIQFREWKALIYRPNKLVTINNNQLNNNQSFTLKLLNCPVCPKPQKT